MQLRHKFFIALSVLTTLPLLILLFGVVDRMEQEILSRTETELHGSLDKMAAELDLILNNQKAIANGLAKVPAVQHFAMLASSNISTGNLQGYSQGETALQQFFLNYQYSVTSIQALRFIDQTGKTLVKVKEGKIISATLQDKLVDRMFIADQVNRPFFQDALYSDSDVIMSDFELGQVVVGADFCPAIVRYSVPINGSNGLLEGVLVVNMWGTRLDATMKAAMGGYPGSNYIVEMAANNERDGIYLYHPDNTHRFANQLASNYRLSNEISPEQWQEIHASQVKGSLFLDNGRMLFFRKLHPYPDGVTKWLLVIEVAKDTIFAPINSMRQSIWLLLGALLLLSLLLAVWASARLTRPVHRLAEIIRHYADGERGVRYDEPDSARDEISQAGRAFNYLTESLERTETEKEAAVRAACQSERLAALGQLAAGIGHEINNPLMNIMSLASFVETALQDEKREIENQQAMQDLAVLQKECQRCSHIVQGILNFSRQAEPCYESFDMRLLISETLELLRHRIESQSVRLHLQLDDTLVMTGDARQLQQVLVNLLLNALQASPPQANLYITARQLHEQINIEIVDEGKGIDAHDFSRIFDPFFTTKAEGQGTGLGLSISYGIIKKHGGSIVLQNIAGNGICVHIMLPQQLQTGMVAEFEKAERLHG